MLVEGRSPSSLAARSQGHSGLHEAAVEVSLSMCNPLRSCVRCRLKTDGTNAP